MFDVNYVFEFLSNYFDISSDLELICYLVGVTALLFGLFLGFLLSNLFNSFYCFHLSNLFKRLEKLLFKSYTDTKPE